MAKERSEWLPHQSEANFLLTSKRYQNEAKKVYYNHLQNQILEKTSPALIDKAFWITRDVKQRALRGELDYDFQSELKPFGMTPQDELWQRKLIPIVEKYLIKAISGGKAESLFQFLK